MSKDDKYDNMTAAEFEKFISYGAPVSKKDAIKTFLVLWPIAVLGLSLVFGFTIGFAIGTIASVLGTISSYMMYGNKVEE